MTLPDFWPLLGYAHANPHAPLSSRGGPGAGCLENGKHDKQARLRPRQLRDLEKMVNLDGPRNSNAFKKIPPPPPIKTHHCLCVGLSDVCLSDVCLSVCPSVCPSVTQSVSLSLSLSLYVSLSLCMSLSLSFFLSLYQMIALV